MLKTAFVAARDRQRLGEIASVLIGFGVTKVVERLGLAQWRASPSADAAGGHRPPVAAPAGAPGDRDPGPTFVKLGQILASRPDLLTPEWTEELEKLHSQVSPIPWERIRPQLEEDLGAPPLEVFAEFDTTPLAAASIAQVYRARLQTGEEVVVKVLRPGLRKTIEADLRLMGHATRIVVDEWPEFGRYQPQEQMRHLASGLYGELDLINEARNCETIAAIFADRDDIVVPKIHWEWTSERVLVQEFVHGIPPNDHARLDAAGYDKVLLAQKGTDAFLQMALIEGVFHADPHPATC